MAMYSILLKGFCDLRLGFQLFKRTPLWYKVSKPLHLSKSSGVLFSTKHFPMDKINLLKEDVLLYTLEKTNFIRNATIFGITQFIVCCSLGFNVFYTFKDAPISQRDIDTKKGIDFGGLKFRLIGGGACISMGILTAVVTYTLPSRIIKHLTLCKGGNVASIVTHGPFGKTTTMKVPLQNLSCMVSREQAKAYMPLKIKNRWLFFLIDSKGQFCQPALFDISVGSRNWK